MIFQKLFSFLADETKQAERRLKNRYAVGPSFPLSVALTTAGGISRGRIANISAGGLGIVVVSSQMNWRVVEHSQSRQRSFSITPHVLPTVSGSLPSQLRNANGSPPSSQRHVFDGVPFSPRFCRPMFHAVVPVAMLLTNVLSAALVIDVKSAPTAVHRLRAVSQDSAEVQVQ